MSIFLSIHHYLDVNSGAPGTVSALASEYRKKGHSVSIYSFDNLYLGFWIKVHPVIKEVLFPFLMAIHLFRRHKEFDVVDCATGDAWFWLIFCKCFSFFKGLNVTRSHGLEHLEELNQKGDVRLGLVKLSFLYYLYRGTFRLWFVQLSIKWADVVFALSSKKKEYIGKVFCNKEKDLRCV